MRPRSIIPDTAIERLLSIGGAGLAVVGMFDRSRLKGTGLMLVGGAMVGFAIQRRRQTAARAHGNVRPRIPEAHGLVIERSVVVEGPVGQVYAYWRNLENLPKFMAKLESVVERGEGRSTWTAKTSQGTEIVWDAEVVEDRPFESIAWRSLPNASVRHRGVVYFHALQHDRTDIRLYMELFLPFGRLGRAAARLTGEDPITEIDEALRQFHPLGTDESKPEQMTS